MTDQLDFDRIVHEYRGAFVRNIFKIQTHSYIETRGSNFGFLYASEKRFGKIFLLISYFRKKMPFLRSYLKVINLFFHRLLGVGLKIQNVGLNESPKFAIYFGLK